MLFKEFFICPNCGEPLCIREKVEEFSNNYCGNCGYELTSAKKEALTLVEEES